jgi:hypothetical protein
MPQQTAASQMRKRHYRNDEWPSLTLKDAVLYRFGNVLPKQLLPLQSRNIEKDDLSIR